MNPNSKDNVNFSFSQVPSAEIQRSVFDLSHVHKTTHDASYLIPLYLEEVYPGDTFHVKSNVFARLSTPLVPIMDNMYYETFWFFVPYRLVWDNWQKFCGEQANPADSTDFLIPIVTAPSGGWGTHGLADYFGLPLGIEGITGSALPFRAYNLIWNEWFRDENLQNSLTVPTGDGPDTYIGSYSLQIRNKAKDYVTAGLPWPQKGPGVSLPLGTTAAVYGDGYALSLTDGTYTSGLFNNGSLNLVGDRNALNHAPGWADGAPSYLGSGKAVGVMSKAALGTNHSGLYADLESASAATINSLRQAFALQRFLERDARGGTRYRELILSHFKVMAPDFRLQRPEFLGGSSKRISINPVQQTAPDASTPLGHLAAYGTVFDDNGGFHKAFCEHGLVICLGNVRGQNSYQQGMRRFWKEREREEKYWPVLAHLGEQAVYNYELYTQGTADDNNVFAYMPRYDHHRSRMSLITGKFRSTDATPLDMYHLAEEFMTLPVLNSSFVQDKTQYTLDRAIAINSEPQFKVDVAFEVRAARPMPTYGEPGYLDHY